MDLLCVINDSDNISLSWPLPGSRGRNSNPTSIPIFFWAAEDVCCFTEDRRGTVWPVHERSTRNSVQLLQTRYWYRIGKGQLYSVYLDLTQTRAYAGAEILKGFPLATLQLHVYDSSHKQALGLLNVFNFYKQWKLVCSINWRCTQPNSWWDAQPEVQPLYIP